ncbi:MAG TPA: VWA domain-containing protein, partial [Thermoanaerobaculia bacterium]|nr:VWA domain-containing protein [Thermoanaerobaculia bacterium]
MTPAFLSTRALAGFFENGKALLPTLLFAALAVALGLALARRAARRRERLISPSLAQKAGLLPKEPSRILPVALALLVVLGTGLALARPRWGITTEKAERKGADVVLLVDTSASMRASDVSPSRFTLARQAAQSLIDRLGGDRVALVACEGEAQVLVPLTLDAAAAGQIARDRRADARV